MFLKTIWLIGLFLLSICLSTSANEYKLKVNSDELIYGIMQKENPTRNPNAVGDKHLSNKSYGLLQIRAPYLRDVNRIAGKEEIMQVWGKEKLTMKDMKDPAKAKWSFHVYLSYYGELYTQKTGKVPTAEVYARIHNGGPDGWRERKTFRYGRIVMSFIMEYRMIFKVA